MKKTTIILLCVAAVACMALTGFTGYYIGSKSHKQDTTQVASNPLAEATTTDVIDEVTLASIKEELKNEVKEEVRTELYDEVYEQAMADVETELQKRLDELEAEQKEAEEEAAKQEETKTDTENNKTETKKDNTQKTTEQPKQEQTTEQPKQEQTTEQPKQKAYINVHDVTASASGGSAAIEAALNSAVDSSSGTVYCNASSITGIGTFPIYWTSTDGATATSYITITE